jgi:hypothetical protein
MGTGRNTDLPADLESGRQQLEQWRRGRKLHTPIPEWLWARAVKLAAKYGVSRTARVLRVGYYSLQERVERATACSPASSPTGSKPAFLELAVASAADTGECLVEWEDPTGAKMRIQLKGVQVPDLVALSRSFWEGQR